MSDADLRRNLRPGDLLVVRHDFAARSPDELTLRRNDRVELLQLDEGFWDGWWLGRHIADNRKGLFPGVYTTPASNHPSAQPGAPASGTTVTTDTTATTDTPATSSLSYSYQQQQQQPGSDSEPDPTIQELWQPVSSIVNSLTDDFQYDNSQVGIGPAPAMSQAPTDTEQETQHPQTQTQPQPLRNDNGPPPITTPKRRSSTSARSALASRGSADSADTESPVLNETLSFINAHITKLNAAEKRGNSSGNLGENMGGGGVGANGGRMGGLSPIAQHDAESRPSEIDHEEHEREARMRVGSAEREREDDTRDHDGMMHAHEHEHEHDLDAEPEPETESETELEPDADDGQPMYPTAAAPPPTIATRPQTQDSSHRPSSQQQQQHVLRHQPGFINDSGSEYSAAMSSPTRRGYPTATAPDSGASAVMQPQYHHYNTSAVRPSTASSNSTAQSRSHSRSHWFPPQSQYSPSPTHSPTQSHQAPSHTHNRSQSGVPALTPNIVRTWPPSVVAAHLTSIGVDPQHAAVLEEQEITGDVLLEMEQSTMFMKEFNLGTMGRRLKTWYRIKAFQEEVKGNGERERREAEEMGMGGFGGIGPGGLGAAMAALRESAGTLSVRQSMLGMDENAQQQQMQQQPTSTFLPRIPAMSVGRPASPPRAFTSMSHRKSSSSSSSHNITPGAPAPAPGAPTSSLRYPYADLPPAQQYNYHSRAHHPRNRSAGSTSLASDRPPTQMSQYSGTGGAPAPIIGGPNTAAAYADSYHQPSPTQFDVDRGYFSEVEPAVPHTRSRNYFKKSSKGMANVGIPGAGVSGAGAASAHVSPTSPEARTRSRSDVRGGPLDIAARFSSLGGFGDHHHQNSNQQQHRYGKSGGNVNVNGFVGLYGDQITEEPVVTNLEEDEAGAQAAAAGMMGGGAATTDEEGRRASHGEKRPSVDVIRRAFGQIGHGHGLGHGQRTASESEKAKTGGNANASVTSPTAGSFETGQQGQQQHPPSSGEGNAAPATDFSTTFPLAHKTPTKTSGTARTKSKKETSAYTKGLEKKTPQEQLESGCDFYGWMKKRSSNLMTTWRPRFFILRGRRLSYYGSELDREERGVIDISGHRVIADNDLLVSLHASLTGSRAVPPTSAHPIMGAENGEVGVGAGVGGGKMRKQGTNASAVSEGEERKDEKGGRVNGHRPHHSHSQSYSAAGSASASGSSGGANAHAHNPKDSKDKTDKTDKTPFKPFIFKLVPPKPGTVRSVQFTKPSVHYFQVDNIQQGRLWMAALLKATIDRDPNLPVRTTNKQKTISLKQAAATNQRPPALMQGGVGLGLGLGMGMGMFEEDEGGLAEGEGEDEGVGVGGPGPIAGLEQGETLALAGDEQQQQQEQQQVGEDLQQRSMSAV